MKAMKKDNCIRFGLYLLGMLILALGICLNTKTALGVSPIISIAYVFHSLTGIKFADATLLLYVLFVIVEMIIHSLRKEKKKVILDLPQIMVSLIFSRFVDLFDMIIPEFTIDYAGTIWAGYPARIIILAIAIILTGIGAALSLNMRIVPNPGDGIVQTLADTFKKETGFMKNFFDISCVTISVITGLLVKHHLIGIGIGTVCAMIGVGRVVFLFNRFLKQPLQTASGIQE